MHYVRVSQDNSSNRITVETPVTIEFKYWNYLKDSHLNFSLFISTVDGTCIFNSASHSLETPLGLVGGVCHIPGNFLNDGTYQITIMIVKDRSLVLSKFKDLASFTVSDIPRDSTWHGKWPGLVRPN